MNCLGQVWWNCWKVCRDPAWLVDLPGLGWRCPMPHSGSPKRGVVPRRPHSVCHKTAATISTRRWDLRLPCWQQHQLSCWACCPGPLLGAGRKSDKRFSTLGRFVISATLTLPECFRKVPSTSETPQVQYFHSFQVVPSSDDVAALEVAIVLEELPLKAVKDLCSSLPMSSKPAYEMTFLTPRERRQKVISSAVLSSRPDAYLESAIFQRRLYERRSQRVTAWNRLSVQGAGLKNCPGQVCERVLQCHPGLLLVWRALRLSEQLWQGGSTNFRPGPVLSLDAKCPK